MAELKLVAASQGASSAQQALGLLGLRFEEVARLAPENQLEVIGNALARISNEAQRTRASVMIFGKAGAKLLPAFMAGVPGGRRQARELGLTIDESQAEAADRLGDSLGLLAAQAKTAAFHLGASLAPYVQQLVQEIQPLLAQFIVWIQQNSQLAAALAAIAAAVTLFGAKLIALGASIHVIGSALGGVAAVLGFLLSPIGLVTVAVAGLAIALGAAFWDDLAGWWEWGRDLLVSVWDRIRAELEASAITWELFKETAIFAIEAIPTVLHWLWDNLKTFAAWMWNNWPQVFIETGKLILQVFQSIGNMAAATWQEILKIFSGEWPDFTQLGVQFSQELAKLAQQAGRIVQGLDLPELDLSEVNPERVARIRQLQQQRQEAIDQALERFRQERAERPAPAAATAPARRAGDWQTAVRQVQQELSSQGAFSAAAARGLAVGDSLARQQVDLLREVNEHLEEIERNTDMAFE